MSVFNNIVGEDKKPEETTKPAETKFADEAKPEETKPATK